MIKRCPELVIVTGVLPNRDSEIKVTIVRVAKTNTIHKRPVNKLFTTENADKAREQRLRREAAVIGEYEH